MILVPRKWLTILLATALLLPTILCGAILAVGLLLSAPAPSSIGPVPPELPGAIAVLFPSASGSTIHGWWVPGHVPGGGGAVILMHGLGADRRQMIPRARFLQDHGFSSLLFDFEAHGESPGRRITFGKLEALDAEAAVHFVKLRLPEDRIGVIGVSLGAAAAVLPSTPLNVDAIVLESVYPAIDDALSNGLAAKLGPFFGPMITPLSRLLLPPSIGLVPSELRPIDRIGSLTAPVLLAAGTQDHITTLAEARHVFEQLHAPKQFWQVEGAGHVDLARFDPQAYWRVILPFLSEHLQQSN